MKISEHDMVRLTQPLADQGIEAGAVGVVVLVYQAEPPSYEVEFCDASGGTIALATVPDNFVELVTGA